MSPDQLNDVTASIGIAFRKGSSDILESTYEECGGDNDKLLLEEVQHAPSVSRAEVPRVLTRASKRKMLQQQQEQKEQQGQQLGDKAKLRRRSISIK